MDINFIFKNEIVNQSFVGDKILLDYSMFADEGSAGKLKLPHKIIFAAVPPFSELSLELSDQKINTTQNVLIQTNQAVRLENDSILTYSDSEPDQSIYITDFYPAEEIEVIDYIWIRDYYCAVIKINTHRYNWKRNELSELKNARLSFTYHNIKPFTPNNKPYGEFDNILSEIIINYEYASEYRSIKPYNSAADTSGNWIDYSKEYVKLAIPKDGIYRITYSDIQSYGINPIMVDPKTFKLFWQGQQMPIYVRGQEDGSFDLDDYIDFWMVKNYSLPNYRTVVATGTDYINFMDRYNDTTFVWLTWGGSFGLRADSIAAITPGLSDTISSHIAKTHLERDIRLWYYDGSQPRTQHPFWQEHKVWTWETIGNSGNRAFTFQARDFVTDTPVHTISRLISNAGDIVINAHKHGASLNSTTPSDTIIFDYRKTVNFTSYFNSNQLLQGNNTYRVFGMPTQASFHRSLIDWVDIDYYRNNRAFNDSLKIVVPDSVQKAVRVIKADGFTAGALIHLYKIKPPLKIITAYSNNSGVITFTDTVSGGDQYYIIKNDYLNSPAFVTKKQFVNLRDSNRGADYILISHKSLQQSVTSYKNFIASEYDHRVELVFVDDIYDEFAFGFNRAESIRDFLTYAAANWQSPMPSFLNLIGDANYDYKFVIFPAGGNYRKNLVPSYGQPVSDVWYATWDSSSLHIPQMFVGRIPVTTNEEVNFYLQKHQSYVNRGYDEWNKYYLFFSGGEIANPGQLAQIKQANDNLFNNYVKPAPVGGTGTHFYKTINPPSNLGPYTQAQIQEAIRRGGLFISYIGHSGTQTWDNGIISTSDLKNNYTDRHSLISDFGCSTGKFAEPDVDAFGELFIIEQPNGQAINYLGNSNLGFLSTSLRFPELFYRQFLLDSVLTVGRAHVLAKVKQYNDYGFSEVNQAFGYCNLLFGDPVVSFRTPMKPNLVAKESYFSIVGDNPNDLMDTVIIRFEANNWGRVPFDSVDFQLTHKWSDSTVYQTEFKIPVPLFKDTLLMNIPIMKRVGNHTVTVELDKYNLIDELDEDDNVASFTFTVYSTSVRPIETEKYYTTGRNRLTLLNPTLRIPDVPEEIIFSIADNPEFQGAMNQNHQLDTLVTRIQTGSLSLGQRYWWRAKMNNPLLEWSEAYSFKNISQNFEWFIDESFKPGDLSYNNTFFDSILSGWTLSTLYNTLKVSSAGSDDGEFGSVLFNNQEYLPTTFYWGIATAIIDPVTFEPHTFKYFLYWDPNPADSLSNHLDSLQAGTIVAFAICADGHQAVFSRTGGAALRLKLKNEFGSVYADSVAYRDSWSMLGIKGAAYGTVPESFKRRYFGVASVDTAITVVNEFGSVTFPLISKATEWKYVIKSDSIPEGASVEYIPLGIKHSGEIDTLASLVFVNDSSSITSIDAATYPMIKLLAKLDANPQLESPLLKTLGARFISVPELAINYQVVSVSADTIYESDSLTLRFDVYNVGFADADSFNVLLSLVKEDNSSRILFDSLLQLSADGSKRFDYHYKTNLQDGKGNLTFRINIDNENRVDELYKDNNFYEFPFYVKEDTSTTSVSPTTVSVTFDGIEIFDGEYVSSNPEITIELNYPFWFPVYDTTAIEFHVDNNRVPYSVFNINFDTVNRKIVYKYSPEFDEGEHYLSIYGENVYGKLENTPGFTRLFTVTDQLRLEHVYNYPNPFKDNTAFTCTLTVVPDELRIRIYTVAGRLIKEIKKIQSELNPGFNKIEWDGRDADGDLVANGVYLYKVIVKRGDETENITQKLAIVR